MEVYPPSEDTFLLIEALRAERARIQGAVKAAPIAIEIGCGSGAVIEAVSGSALGLVSPCWFGGTDVNPDAVRAARKRCSQKVDIVETDLLDGLELGLERAGGAGLIIFNPPYVPTDQAEFNVALSERNLYASWAGGADGREVIDRAIPRIPGWLSSSGTMYMILLAANRPPDVIARLQKIDLKSEIVRETKAGDEELCVLRIWHSENAT